jgi:hypothetical protein
VRPWPSFPATVTLTSEASSVRSVPRQGLHLSPGLAASASASARPSDAQPLCNTTPQVPDPGKHILRWGVDTIEMALACDERSLRVVKGRCTRHMAMYRITCPPADGVGMGVSFRLATLICMCLLVVRASWTEGRRAGELLPYDAV